MTPKGGPSGLRYNAPISPDSKTSPGWVPTLMFGLLLLGIVIIFFNYVGWMPGGMKNVYLMLGLGCILGGIVTATQLH